MPDVNTVYNHRMTTTWTPHVAAITLCVQDVARSREFYRRTFDLPVHYEDDVSVVFDLGGVLINLLQEAEAVELLTPAPVGDAAAGSRLQLTLDVSDVDEVAAALTARGVTLLNGPQDRPWGIRTAAFADPDGHIWEIAH